VIRVKFGLKVNHWGMGYGTPNICEIWKHKRPWQCIHYTGLIKMLQ